MKVLFITPPPMPMSVEKKPMSAPQSGRMGKPGMSLPRRQLSRLKNMRRLTATAITAKMPLSPCPDTCAATRDAATTPSGSGMSQLFSSSMSTAPRALWAKKERKDVGTMMPSDVATATCMRTASSTPTMARN